jgi:uncharacterized DUF497 family protein
VVKIEFDPDKSAINIAKHGLPLASFAYLDMDAAVIKQDARRDYGETRYVATAPLDGRLHIACFVIRGETFRPISLRKANKDERREYEKATEAANPPR